MFSYLLPPASCQLSFNPLPAPLKRESNKKRIIAWTSPSIFSIRNPQSSVVCPIRSEFLLHAPCSMPIEKLIILWTCPFYRYSRGAALCPLSSVLGCARPFFVAQKKAGPEMALPSGVLDHLLVNVIGRFLCVKINHFLSTSVENLACTARS